MALPLLRSFDLLQNQWKSILDPIVANAILQGIAVNNVAIATSATDVPVKLGRTMQGFFITDINANAVVWRTAALSADILTLQASAACTISLWCF